VGESGTSGVNPNYVVTQDNGTLVSKKVSLGFDYTGTGAGTL
jgi:hypothetical protein